MMVHGPVRRLQTAAISWIGGNLLSSLLASTRRELIAGQEYERSIVRAGIPALYVLWHGRLLPCAYNYRHFAFGTVISRNRDGDYISRVVEGWGYRVIRGSTSRGGASALRSIVGALRTGTSIAVTPDGPRGPRQKMKLGPIRVAQKTGVPIVPVSASSSGAWYFGRWDRFLVPKPFSWVPVALGEPLHVNAAASADELASCMTVVEERLNQLTRFVDEAAVAART